MSNIMPYHLDCPYYQDMNNYGRRGDFCHAPDTGGNYLICHYADENHRRRFPVCGVYQNWLVQQQEKLFQFDWHQ